MAMEVGERIRQLRELKGYTVNKLANQSGVSQSYLRDIELSNKNPTVAFLELLCEQLEISMKDFFEESSGSLLEKDPLVHRIYRMSPEQREKLLEFLNTIE